jgi:hypothetical protein
MDDLAFRGLQEHSGKNLAGLSAGIGYANLE